MFLNIILLIIIALIAFWHYVQGFFSATLSAALVVISAALALAYAQPVVAWIKPEHFVESSQTISLCALFTGIYLVLRLIFDRLIPGNVRLDNIADKTGAAIVGIIAGIFVAGVVAVAAQMLPVGPAIGGYARYPVHDDIRTALNANPSKDVMMYEPLEVADFSGPQTSLYFKPDETLVGAVDRFSLHYLDCDQPLDCIHPDLLQELFGQRLGFSGGGRTTAPNFSGKTPTISVAALFRLKSIMQYDNEPPELRANFTAFPNQLIRPGDGQTLLVVRAIVENAEDSDGIFRFCTGNCRLVVRTGDGCTDYYPLGTLEAGRRLYADRVDDPLFVKLSGQKRAIDLVFMVDSPLDDTSPLLWLEIKKMGIVDLASATDASGNALTIGPTVTLDPAMPAAAMRQHEVQPEPLVAIIDPKDVKAAPLHINSMEISDRLPVAVPLPMTRPGERVQNKNINAFFNDGKFSDLTANLPIPPATPAGGATLDRLYVPDNKFMVQFTCQPNPDRSWNWAGQLSRFEMIDIPTGKHIKPSGVFCIVNLDNSSKMLAGRYVAASTVTSIKPVQHGTSEVVYLIFLMPSQKGDTVLTFDDRPIGAYGAASDLQPR